MQTCQHSSVIFSLVVAHKLSCCSDVGRIIRFVVTKHNFARLLIVNDADQLVENLSNLNINIAFAKVVYPTFSPLCLILYRIFAEVNFDLLLQHALLQG